MSYLESKIEQVMGKTKIKRRDFILATLVGLTGVGLQATGLLPLRAFMRKRSIADLHFVDFDALRGERFQLFGPGGQPDIVQLDVVKPSTRSQACFSLAFCAAKGLDIGQGNYTFAHPKLGLFDLFIVPAQSVTHEERYIAIINRL